MPGIPCQLLVIDAENRTHTQDDSKSKEAYCASFKSGAQGGSSGTIRFNAARQIVCIVETCMWNEIILTHAKAGEDPEGGVLH